MAGVSVTSALVSVAIAAGVAVVAKVAMVPPAWPRVTVCSPPVGSRRVPSIPGWIR